MKRENPHDTAPHLAIGALSRGAGVKIETIRYYERVALLAPPARTEGGHRLYDSAHLLRLNFIRRARELGFTLEEVRALLKLADSRDQPCAEVQKVAAHHLTDVRAKLAMLRTIEDVLAEMVERCGKGSSPGCPLLEALLDKRPQSVATNLSDEDDRSLDA